MNPLIALDFDGVICDSVDECLVTAHNAYYALKGQARWVESLAELDPEVVERFRQLRQHAANGADFWLVYHLAVAESGDSSAVDFGALRVAHQANLSRFEPLFFQARHKFRTADSSKWVGLNRQYPEFQAGWAEVRSRYPVYLVSTKDLASIEQFNRVWDLGLQPDRIWTKERGLNKAHAITAIAAETGRTPADILFVDDYPGHLTAVAQTGARCFWAAWGYLGVYGDHPAPNSDFTPITTLSGLLEQLP